MRQAPANRAPGLPGWTAWVLALPLFWTGCGNQERRAELNLPVFFTCDTRGRLEPCGCFTGQYGGLTRLKTTLEAAASRDALRLDAGDALAGREDYHRIEYAYMLRAFAAMHYDALNIGHREAQLSAAHLQEIRRTTPVPILSANLRDTTSGQPIFDAYRIVERGPCRIAILGLLDPRGLETDLGEGLVVDDMETTLARHLSQLRSKADVIVLLAFTDEATLVRLAQQFYELDIILGGKVRQPAQELGRENRSLIYFVTNEARALGILRVKWRPGAPLQVTDNEIRLLHDQIPQDETLRALAQAYREEVRRTPLAIDDPAQARADLIPGVRSAADYVGTQRCVDCHRTAGDVWAKSGHAHAFATLVGRQADADPKCLPCHTVGFGTASGYRREFAADKLVHVGCESCHGPGSLHVRQHEGDATVSFRYRPLGAGDCQKCHYGEFSRPFDWDAFWPAVKHGLESAQAGAGGSPSR